MGSGNDKSVQSITSFRLPLLPEEKEAEDEEEEEHARSNSL